MPVGQSLPSQSQRSNSHALPAQRPQSLQQPQAEEKAQIGTEAQVGSIAEELRSFQREELKVQFTKITKKDWEFQQEKCLSDLIRLGFIVKSSVDGKEMFSWISENQKPIERSKKVC